MKHTFNIKVNCTKLNCKAMAEKTNLSFVVRQFYDDSFSDWGVSEDELEENEGEVDSNTRSMVTPLDKI